MNFPPPRPPPPPPPKKKEWKKERRKKKPCEILTIKSEFTDKLLREKSESLGQKQVLFSAIKVLPNGPYGELVWKGTPLGSLPWGLQEKKVGISDKLRYIKG